MTLLASALALTVMQAQPTRQVVQGTVTDDQQIPLPGVNVLVKGTMNGIVTDGTGAYRLDVSPEDILAFSFIGFEDQQIAVGNQTTINVVMKEESKDLGEVVVVGYGAQKKSLVTGAISSIKSDDIANSSSTRVEQALQGRTSGVTILPVSGSPGAGAKIRIRGTGTNGNSNPLYIVDGMKTSSIDNLDPNDIESIEVLKDAASAAIYGTEGANGVIIISTKKGKKGDGQISYDFQYGIQTVRTNMELMNAIEYAQYMKEQGATINFPANTGKGTNWLNEIFESAPMQKHHLSFTGGNERTSYLTSGSFTTQDGIVGGSRASYDRFTFRLNATHQMKKWMEVGNALSFSHSKRKSIGEDDEYRGILNNALLIDPITPVLYAKGTEPQKIKDLVNGVKTDGTIDEKERKTILTNEDGLYYALPLNVDGEIGNPVSLLQTYNNKITTDNLLSTFYAKISPIKGFNFTSRFGMDLSYVTDHSWSKVYYVSSERNNSSNTITDNLNKTFSWLWENFATYQFNLDQHNFTMLGGYSAQDYQHPNYYLYSGPMLMEGDAYAYHDHTTSREQDKVAGTIIENSMTSVFGRLSYNYANKYMFEGSLRQDAASEFPEDNKGAIFSSASLGWVVSQESFWNLEALDYLKLRASWGQNGSKSNLPGNEDISFVTTTDIFYPNPTGGYFSGARIDKLTNSSLVWEKSEQLDLGIDIRALGGKISFSADYYKKVTKDLIIRATPPLSGGAQANPFINGGDVTNSGFEFEAGFNQQFGDLKVTLNANLSTLKNEVTSLKSEAPIAGVNVRGYDLTWFEQGKPIWYFNGYKTAGINKADGLPNIVGKDGQIKARGTETAADLQMIGDPHPDFLYGASINLEYKQFDFSFFMQGTQGNDIYTAWYRPDRATSNKPKYFFDNRWTADNHNASMPKADGSSDLIYRSDLMVQDGSYLRIKQIQLGYQLPTDLISKVGITRSRIFVSLDDYFTFTNYKGLDPEAGSNNDQSQGIDRGVYPIPGKLMFGLSVNF
ncbi:TonB-linked SusC/RagA family outer membrane protein [Breznakibacter xylanolyticus]|uniref:TonB-linked SusC/RagA family outer membrane protein n=1 Tax=Breznakibacter xylanolyticus TaxID=990 RepID=A0A2W7NKS5_9BACT|nr:TonB-dependent receptor [Breznakibacter xylanolyticus]PZX20073.1 TonB-linked SusC/RagA family outer membrane protein [Breznakibacter xylanolyticus]